MPAPRTECIAAARVGRWDPTETTLTRINALVGRVSVFSLAQFVGQTRLSEADSLAVLTFLRDERYADLFLLVEHRCPGGEIETLHIGDFNEGLPRLPMECKLCHHTVRSYSEEDIFLSVQTKMVRPVEFRH